MALEDFTNIQGWPTPEMFINGGKMIATFASAQQTIIGSAKSYVVPHGLSGVPQFVRVVLRCLHADVNSGMSVGQELDCGLISSATSAFAGGAITADATNVTFQTASIWTGNEANVQFSGLSNSTFSAFSNFAIVLYALHF